MIILIYLSAFLVNIKVGRSYAQLQNPGNIRGALYILRKADNGKAFLKEYTLLKLISFQAINTFYLFVYCKNLQGYLKNLLQEIIADAFAK